MIIASNFKTNHTRQSTALFVNEVNDYIKKNNISSEVFVFPTATSLDSFEVVSNFSIGAQNAYPTVAGSFTGEIGTSQLDEFGIKTILIGHSERRHILGETQNKIAKKYDFYKELGYKIIYCIGEPLEVKNKGLDQTLEYIYEQFNEIDTKYENLILAYEPVWAIGTGLTATAAQAQEIHAYIRSLIVEKYGNEVAENTTILYGGSCNPGNAKELFANPDVDGGLIGGASLKSADFKGIIDAF